MREQERSIGSGKQQRSRHRSVSGRWLRPLAAVGLSALLLLDFTTYSLAFGGFGGFGGRGGGFTARARGGDGPPRRIGGYRPPRGPLRPGSGGGGRIVVTGDPGHGAPGHGGPRRGGSGHGGYGGYGGYGGLGPSGGGASDGGDGPSYSGRSARRTSHQSHSRHQAEARPGRTRAAPLRPPYVPDEVVTRIAPGTSSQALGVLARRYRLVELDTQTLQLTGTRLVRWRIAGGRSVPSVVRALGNERRVVAAVQPNYIFTLQQGSVTEGDPGQYALAKLHLPQAHQLAKGTGVRVAVVDSAIDRSQPELDGAIADSFDAIGGASGKLDPHGTEIAGIIAAHGKLMGAAPAARILAVRAFAAAAGGAEGTTFGILKGIDWAAMHAARVINLSFAGPSDPELGNELGAAREKGIVLIAAAGNAGAQSPPLYPAADPHVIAVTATDAHDRLFAAANRGAHIAIGAPGVDILAPAPADTYQVASGTSFSAAYVSGIAALLIERQPDMTPDVLRGILISTAQAVAAKGRDEQPGAGLADAYRAVQAVQSTASNAEGPR